MKKKIKCEHVHCRFNEYGECNEGWKTWTLEQVIKGEGTSCPKD